MKKVMLITGGGRGIGAATARLAAADGYTVAINYVKDRDTAEKLAGEVGGKAIQADVAVEADIVRLFAEVDRIGRVSALVNNAGVVDKGTRVEHLSAARIARMFAI